QRDQTMIVFPSPCHPFTLHLVIFPADRNNNALFSLPPPPPTRLESFQHESRLAFASAFSSTVHDSGRRYWPHEPRHEPRPGSAVRVGRDGEGPALHLYLPLRRAFADRQLRLEAQRPGANSRRVQADRDAHTGPADLRTPAATGGAE